MAIIILAAGLAVFLWMAWPRIVSICAEAEHEASTEEKWKSSK